MQRVSTTFWRPFWPIVLALSVSAVATGCGGGGGSGQEQEEPPPPASVTLTGSALYAERIALQWAATETAADQAYAITVNGSVVGSTTRQGYQLTALPQTRYCFTVVVGALVPPMNTFFATGPTSNELCLTTPTLPPLAPGWVTGDAGLGPGDLPAIARRPPGSALGLYACVAGTGDALFGMLGSRGVVLPSFAFPGESCAVADNGSDMPALHALTRSGTTVTYRRAIPGAGSWSFSTGDTVDRGTDAATLVSQALDGTQRPQVLYAAEGQVYWTRQDAGGGWSVRERVGPGTIGSRSLTVAADGTAYALLAEGGGVRVWRRDGPGHWTRIHAIDGTLAPQFGRGPGSIVAPASGGLRLVFLRTTGVAYVEWSGGSGHWTETLVDADPTIAPPALALDLAGEPLIAYGDWRLDLRLSRRHAGRWSTVVVDARGDLAAHTDIEVDNQGTVYILYSKGGGAAQLATGR